MTEIPSDQLEAVQGGARRQPQQQGGVFGFFDNIYKNIVFHFGSQVGGNKLAEKMYGSHVTARDKQRAQAAMHKFLADGHKLPKGVPNIFG